MGVAQGMAKKEKGIAVFAATVGYLTLNVVMSVYLKATGTLADPAVAAQVGQGTVLGIQTLKIEAMGGLIAGLVAAKVADKFTFGLRWHCILRRKEIHPDHHICLHDPHRPCCTDHLECTDQLPDQHFFHLHNTIHWKCYLLCIKSCTDPIWSAPCTCFPGTFHRGRRYLYDQWTGICRYLKCNQ